MRCKQILLFLLKGPPLSDHCDWRSVLSVARYSKVTPLLFSVLRDSRRIESVPGDIAGDLKHSYLLNLSRNVFILEEFSRLEAAFQDADVAMMPLKGVSLLRTVYRMRPAVRRLEDIDILVKEEDKDAAAAALASCGYAAGNGIQEKGRKAAMYFPRNGAVILAPVHLHWHINTLSAPFRRLCGAEGIEMEEIWSDSLRDGDGFLRIRTEHEVITLCEHAMRHGFARLNLLYDIHARIEHCRTKDDCGRLDWEVLIDTAQRWGLVFAVWAGLHLTRRMLGCRIPEGVEERLRPPQADSLLTNLSLFYVLNAACPREDICSLFYLGLSVGIINRLRFLGEAISMRLMQRRPSVSTTLHTRIKQA